MAGLLGLAIGLFLFSLAVPSTSIVTAAAVSSANDGSVLQALLESQFSEWMELVERAQMLHPLEQLVGSGGKLTIFAPQNHQLSPQVKSFLLKPSNAHLLKKMVQFHVLPQRVTVPQWRDISIISLAGESLQLHSMNQYSSGDNSNNNLKMYVGDAEIVAPDFIVRADGVVHGVDQMLLPMSVQQDFVAFSTRHLATPLPTGAPGLDLRRIALGAEEHAANAVEVEEVTLPTSPVVPVAAPSPFLAPAPGPGPSASPYYDGTGTFGDKEVTTFVTALQRFGGYQEFAGLLVDMTSLGWEISRLVNQGRKLTILAPDDQAWKDAHLTTDQLTSPTELEDILHYHVLSEYQTEESLYTTVRRNGKTQFSTLKHPLKVSAHEQDGLVVFGEGEMQAGVFDHDIFADGSVSVQGVDKVLFPSSKTTDSEPETKHQRSVLEMLQLPSRASIDQSKGPGRMAAGASTISAVASFLAIAVINVLV